MGCIKQPSINQPTNQPMHITIPTNIVLDDPNKIGYSIAWDPVTNINCSSYLKILHCKATVIHRLGSGLEAANFLLSLFWHKLKNQLQKRNQNTTTSGEPMLTEGKSRNNIQPWSYLPHDH
jgi:hypothetical protein